MQMGAHVTAHGHVFDGQGPEIVRKELEAAMHEAVAFLEKKVKEFAPVGVYGAQGGLLSTIRGEVEKGAAFMKGIVFHGSKYGDVIEKGRTAGKGMLPEGTLIRWIELKMGLDAAAAQKIEYVVRRKIGKKGFPGAHMFEKAWKAGWPVVQQIFEKRGFMIAEALGK